MSLRTFFLVLLAGALAAACGRPDREGSTVRIELDAFSGRPNLVWEVPGRDASELRRRLRARGRSLDRPEPTGLGYRGFLLHGVAPEGADAVRVFDGSIWTGPVSDRRSFADVEDLEGLLIALAGAREVPAGLLPSR